MTILVLSIVNSENDGWRFRLCVSSDGGASVAFGRPGGVGVAEQGGVAGFSLVCPIRTGSYEALWEMFTITTPVMHTATPMIIGKLTGSLKMKLPGGEGLT
ncbi:MAG: hypothetical protein U0M96_07710 [Eggerthellaceae bacterium]